MTIPSSRRFSYICIIFIREKYSFVVFFLFCHNIYEAINAYDKGKGETKMQ